MQALRPDRLVSMSHSYVSTSLGSQFLHDIERELDLAYIVENEVKCNTPVLMCSVPGYDASGRVMDLAAQLGKQLTDIAIGEFISGYILVMLALHFLYVTTNSVIHSCYITYNT